MTSSGPPPSADPTAARPELFGLNAAIIAVVAGIASYVVWFGWSDPVNADYAAWQWLGWAATFGAAAAVLGRGQRIVTAVVLMPLVTTVVWFRHASTDEDEMGLSVIGIPFVLGATVAFAALVAGIADGVSERRHR